MPKLPALKPRQIVKFLEKHGFVLDHASGSHFIYYHPITKRRAVVAKHNREIPKGMLLVLLKEAGFTRDEIIKFFSS